MTLCSNFEGLESSILHHTPLPSIDSVVSKLVAEETCLKYLTEKVSLPPSSTSMFATLSQPFTQNQNKGYARVANDECIFANKRDSESLNILSY